jgi:hypothetical protein
VLEYFYMSIESVPLEDNEKSLEPLTPQEEVFLQVLEAYKKGECPHHAGRETPHARGQMPVGAFCSENCLDHFEHEYRVKYSTEVNVIRDHETRFNKANLNTCHEDLDHALVKDLLERQAATSGEVTPEDEPEDELEEEEPLQKAA